MPCGCFSMRYVHISGGLELKVNKKAVRFICEVVNDFVIFIETYPFWGIGSHQVTDYELYFLKSKNLCSIIIL